MNKNNNSFVIIFGLAALMLAGIISQNVVSVLKPKTAQQAIDVAKVKQDLEAAGLAPKEAMYWEKL